MTYSSAKGNQSLSQALHILIIKWLSKSLFIKHVTYRTQDILHFNINTQKKTFYLCHKPRATVKMYQSCDMVSNVWIYTAGTKTPQVSWSHKSNGTEAMKDEFKPQKCHAPRHGNVCQYMSATLCTACNLYTADAQLEVQFVPPHTSHTSTLKCSAGVIAVLPGVWLWPLSHI